jgi:hypothetical protein
MQVALLLLFLVITTILIFVFLKEQDGFANFNPKHDEFVEYQHKTAGKIGSSILFGGHERNLGPNGGNKLLQSYDTPTRYPVHGDKHGLWKMLEKCETLKTMDCDAFDDPEFSKYCGVCFDIGKNSDKEKTAGGLLIFEDDKKAAKKQGKPGLLPDYKATIGFCPAGKLVATKKECLKLQRELLCAKNASFELPGCAQCFTTGGFAIVDPVQSPGVITGSGKIIIFGTGKLNVEEQGFEPQKDIQLNPNSGFTMTVKGKEGTRIKFTLEPLKGQDTCYMSGVINGVISGGTGQFNYDLMKITMVDEKSGRKPRSLGKEMKEKVIVTKMAPAFGQTSLTNVVIVPFSFTDPSTYESTTCNNGPFMTLEDSADFANTNPCYKKGSGPGKYSLECLQDTWDANGCESGGKGYPKDAASASALMSGPGGNFLKLNEIADFIYNKSLVTSTGVDENGQKQSIKEWSAASVFCTGREITSPCDTPEKDKGPLSPDCIVWLWNNQGSKKGPDGKVDRIGATYYPTEAVSLFGSGGVTRGCQTNGTLAPLGADGKNNKDVIAYWQKQGGVNNVKKVMADLHRAANAQLAADDELAPYFRQCYGDIKLAARPENPNKCSSNLLPVSYKPTRGKVIGNFTMTQDYKLEFDITIHGTTDTWGSVLYISQKNFNANNGFGDRTPGIWVTPNSYGGVGQLHVRFGDPSDPNKGFDHLAGCTVGKKSRFTMEAKGKDITVTIDSKTYRMTQPRYRYSGSVIAYSGDPSWHAANCTLDNVCLTLNGNSTPPEPLPDWIQTMQKPNNWKHKPGGLISITIDEDGVVYGVGSGNIVYRCTDITSEPWVPFTTGRLVQVATGANQAPGRQIIGVGTDSNLYRSDGNAPSPWWGLNGPIISDRLWSAGGKDGWTFSLKTGGGNNIFFGDGGMGGTPWNIPGGLITISYAPNELWGIGPDGHVYRYNGTADQIYRQHAKGEKLGTDWAPIPRPSEAPGSGGWAKHVAISQNGKRIVAAGLQPHGKLGNPTNALYAWHDKKWIPVCGARGQIAICDSMIVWVDEQEGRQTTPYGAYSVYYMELGNRPKPVDNRLVNKVDIRNADTQSFNINTSVPLQGGKRVDTNFPNMPDFDSCIKAARAKYPSGNIGVTYLDGNSWMKRDPGTCWAVPMEPFSEGSSAWAWGWKSAFITNGEMPGIPGVTKIQIAGGGNGQHLQLSQVVVYDSRGNNVSIGQVAGGSPVFQANTVPSKATDGVHAPRNWPDMSCSTYQPPGKIVHWEIGLRQPTTVSAIIIYNRNDCCQDRLNHYNMHMFNSNLDLIYWKPNIGSGLVNILRTNSATNQAAQTKGHTNWYCYSNRYGDLYNAFDRPMGPGNNQDALANHYNIHGRREGRNPQC